MPSFILLGQVQMFMDSTLYGCFVVLFAVSTVVLNKRYRTLKVQLSKQSEYSGKDATTTRAQHAELKFWSALGSIMLVLTTIHWAFAWGTMMALVDDRKTRSIMSFMRLVFEMLSLFVGDALIVGLFEFAFNLLLTPPATSTMDNRKQEILRGSVSFVVLRRIRRSLRWWFVSMTALTSCVNLYSTGFIAWKAWSVNKVRHKSIYEHIMHILSIIVESAAIYTAWTIILLVVICGEDLGVWSLLLPISPALYGCTMMLISVRLGLGWALGLGGKAAAQPKSLVLQFAKSVHSEYSYHD